MASKVKSNGDDRLSDLSDSLLHHILSFLDTKHAIQTSVLSSRYTHLWKSTPHLSFDHRITRNNHRFSSLIYQVLLFREPSDIHTLRLLSLDFVHPRDIYNWILAALTRNVKHIEITIHLMTSIDLPNPLFASQTLTTLHISSGGGSNFFFLDFPRTSSLPNLKALSLTGVCFRREPENASNFISSCPSLVKLELTVYGLQGVLAIHALELCELVILTGENHRFFDVRVHAPKLEYFWFEHHVRSRCTIVGGFSRLDCGAVRLEVEGKDKFVALEVLDVRKEYVRLATSVLEAVCGANKLTLNAWTLLVAFSPRLVLNRQFVQFNNLKHLEVNTWLSKDCVFAIIELLRMSPKIENLVLRIIENSNSGKLLNCDEEIFTSTNIVGEGNWYRKQCIFHHLKAVEIHNIIGCMNEFKVLEIMLKSAIILDKMVIWASTKMPSDRRKGLINFRKTLLRIPRASSSIDILFL